MTSVLFLGKKNDPHTARALEFCQSNFETIACFGNWGDPIPECFEWWEGDYIISYLSRWIVPMELLKKAKMGAINFHPGPPEYPGIGCLNFALYNDAKEYGVTCHYMWPDVDTGPIIQAERFPVFESDTVSTLLARTYDFQLHLFYNVAMSIALGIESLVVYPETWKREPYTRKEFNELFHIDMSMTDDEIYRRVRATNYKEWKPSVEVGGWTFELKT